MNSTVIIKSENGVVTYVIGEVVSKTPDQIQSEIAEIEARLASHKQINIDSIKEQYTEKIRLLNEEMEDAINKAEALNEESLKAAQKDEEDLENLKVVLETLHPVSSVAEETSESESLSTPIV